MICNHKWFPLSHVPHFDEKMTRLYDFRKGKRVRIIHIPKKEGRHVWISNLLSFEAHDPFLNVYCISKSH